MSKINNIMNSVELEMIQFNSTLKQMLSDENPIVREAINYIMASQGKQMRPLLVILSAKLNGVVDEKTYLASCLIELTHSASLIHDDIVDEAYMRRGMLSMYAIWRNRNSVLIGDYIFSRAIRVACQHHLYNLLDKISSVIENMSIGELEQSEAAMKLNITEEKYYEIINGKTAELISACAYAGTISANPDPKQQETMVDFGRILGLIFQIKDDMLDYMGDNTTGKRNCNDIREQKITLPLIAALKLSDAKTTKHILAQLPKAKKQETAVKEIYDFVMNGEAMSYCDNRLQELKSEAIECLNYYPNSEHKDRLIGLMDYFIERNK